MVLRSFLETYLTCCSMRRTVGMGLGCAIYLLSTLMLSVETLFLIGQAGGLGIYALTYYGATPTGNAVSSTYPIGPLFAFVMVIVIFFLMAYKNVGGIMKDDATGSKAQCPEIVLAVPAEEENISKEKIQELEAGLDEEFDNETRADIYTKLSEAYYNSKMIDSAISSIDKGYELSQIPTKRSKMLLKKIELLYAAGREEEALKAATYGKDHYPSEKAAFISIREKIRGS